MTYILLLLSIAAPATLAQSCSYVKRPTIVPRLANDAEAQHMCGKYYCAQQLGSDWDYAGYWDNSADGDTSVCHCRKWNCDCTVPMGDSASSPYEPEDYSKALYRWEQGGCLLGWSSNYVNQTEYYGTCADYLGACPWENRDNATRVVKSPEHCQVTKVSFKLAGGVSRISDPTDDAWMGVKLVDQEDNVVKYYARSTDSDDFDIITWDDLAGNGCYRVVLQDGQTGEWSHLKLQDVEIWTGNLQNMMLSDLQCKISSDNTNSVWPFSFTERLVGFGVEWGVDSEGSRAVNGRMSLSASYIYKNSDHPTIVTDVMIATVPRIYDDVASCPRGYERSCFWLPDIDGTDGFDTLSITAMRTLEGVGTALCMKKMPCNPGQQYVTRIVAKTGSDETYPTTVDDNCKIIGRWNPADGPDAKTWISKETGSRWVALYQCTDTCPHKQCANIVIRTMEKSSVPEIDASSKASGDTIAISKTLSNCFGNNTMKFSGTLSTNEAITSQTTYTFSKDIAHSFDADISATASFTATVGFKMFGDDATMTKSRSLRISADAAWSQDYKKGLTNTTQILNTHGFSSQGDFFVHPGEVAFYTANITSFEYATKFVAEADCVDATGDVIESAKLDGVFRGRTYHTDGVAQVTTRTCFPHECSCSAAHGSRGSHGSHGSHGSQAE